MPRTNVLIKSLVITAAVLGAVYLALRDPSAPDHDLTTRVTREATDSRGGSTSMAAPDTSTDTRESLSAEEAVNAASPNESDAEDDVYSIDFAGRVLDEQGQPVPDATVRLLSFDNMRRAKSGAEQLPEPSSTTDAEGRFTLEHQREWQFTLMVTKTGFETKLVGGHPQEGEREAPSYGDIVLRAGRELRGVVLGPDGERVAGARVVPVIGRSSPTYMNAFSSEVPYALAISDAAGEFSLPGIPVGPWAFIAQHARYRSGSATGEMPTAPTAPGSLELRLGAAATILGIVRGLPADPPTLSLSARPVKEEDYTDAYGYDQDGRRHAMHPDGTFEVTGLAPGTGVWLDLWTGDYSRFPSQRRSVRVTAEAGDRDVVIDYSEGFDIALQVVDSVSKEGLEQLFVIIQFGEGDIDLIPPTNAEGVAAWPGGHVLAHAIVQPRPDMPLRVELHSRGYERVRTEVRSFSSSGLLNLGVFELTLEPVDEPEPPIVAEITVLRADGAPAVNAEISIIFPGSRRDSIEFSQRTRARSDENGVVPVRSNEEGLAAVSIDRGYAAGNGQKGVHTDFYSNGSRSRWTDLALRSGQVARVTLTEAPRGELSIIVQRGGVAVTDVSVLLHEFVGDAENVVSHGADIPSRGGWGEVDTCGQIEFAGLGTGRWTLAVRDLETQSMTLFPIEVRAGRQEVSVPFDITSISGLVVTPSGRPVAGALVQQSLATSSAATALRRFVKQQFGATEEVTVLHAARSMASTTTDANGRYTLRFAVPDVDFVIDAAARGMTVGRSESFRTNGSEITLGDIVIEPSGSLKIIQPEGVPNPQIAIVPPTLSSNDAFGDTRRADFTDGVALIHGLRPGEWSVRWILDEAETYDEALRFAVQIRAREITELTVTQ